MVLRPKTRESRSPPGLTRSRIKRILLRYLSVPLDAGWSSPVARQAHNLKVRGSNPLPATTDRNAASLGIGSSVSSRNPAEPGDQTGLAVHAVLRKPVLAAFRRRVTFKYSRECHKPLNIRMGLAVLMIPPDSELWRMAKRLVDIHGARAIGEAVRRADAFAAAGDSENTEVWNRIFGFVTELLNGDAENEGPRH